MFTVDYLCTDKLKAYTHFNYISANKNKYIPKKQLSKNLVKRLEQNEDLRGFAIHIRSKSETCCIEGAVNSKVRRSLARFRRKSSCMSKSVEMLEYSLLILFNKLYWKFEVGW